MKQRKKALILWMLIVILIQKIKLKQAPANGTKSPAKHQSQVHSLICSVIHFKTTELSKLLNKAQEIITLTILSNYLIVP